MKLTNKFDNIVERIQSLKISLQDCQNEINHLEQLKNSHQSYKSSLLTKDDVFNVLVNIENTLEASYINPFGEISLEKEELFINIDYQTLWNIYLCIQIFMKQNKYSKSSIHAQC